jgi:hypothetical protein
MILDLSRSPCRTEEAPDRTCKILTTSPSLLANECARSCVWISALERISWADSASICSEVDREYWYDITDTILAIAMMTIANAAFLLERSKDASQMSYDDIDKVHWYNVL